MSYKRYDLPFNKGRRMLVVTDIHLTENNIGTIPNSKVVLSNCLQYELIPLIRKENITDIVFTGDIIHQGVSTKSTFLQLMNVVKAITSLVDNAFLCIGNHLFLDLLNNPEFFLIQPHDKYKTSEVVIFSKEPTLKTPDTIRCGHLQLNLCHWAPNKADRKYFYKKEIDASMNVSIFHNDEYLPYERFTSSKLDSVYSELDVAIHGHIHESKQMFTYNGTTVIVPGAVGLTSVSPKEFHTEIQLPIISVDTEGNPSLSFTTLNTRAEEYILIRQEHTEDEKSVIDIKKKIKENNLNKVETLDLSGNITYKDIGSLHEYLSQSGYPEYFKSLAEGLGIEPLSLGDIVKIKNSKDDFAMEV